VCDPNAGLHATVALILALEHRRRTGEGMLLEVPMVGGALNVAGEQVVEYSAYGRLLQHDGNRSSAAVPQGIYRTATDDLPFDQGRWVTISVATDEQWLGLRRAIGDPAWAASAALDSATGRRDGHDAIDRELAAWCATRDADTIVDRLWAEGVPVAKVMMPHEQLQVPQLAARGFFTTLDHPVTGPNVHGGFPAIFGGGPLPSELHTSPPPLLGQHNHEVLGGVLGLSEAEIETLERDGVIGTKVGGGMAW
jgi:crotonobetainyl-CoA:carnitine CoA-transferase CaiB-like acyl-CoA transferase